MASPRSTRLLGSETVDVGTIAMPCGESNPEMSEAFTVAPEVVYSPTVPKFVDVTNKSEPDTAIPTC